MKIHNLKQKLMNGTKYDKGMIYSTFQLIRNKFPIIYNIETTNACNMTCEMCPRTTLMTRKVETMGNDAFNNIVSQIKPYTDEIWTMWKDFVEKNYGIDRNDMSENHFFLYIIPKVIVLHGYGDPLLDKNMPKRVKLLTEKGIPSYFSCNPSNIDINKTLEMFKNGLGYIKFSIESVDDLIHKEIRGNASNFSDSYDKILKLIDEKRKYDYKTVIVITMLDLKKYNQKEEYEKLKTAFKGEDVYIYLKSQDQQWYEKKDEGTNSIHWKEFCQFPWSSMTIKSNCDVVECVEDYNNEIVLGNTNEESLYDIWNGEKYNQFRKQHFDLNPHIKCTKECDMKLIGEFFGGK